MTDKKPHEELEAELNKAKKLVKIGGIYSHFKHPHNLYKVVDIAIQEATGEICVIYKTEYGKKLTFVRNLKSWLETPELNGKSVPRFKLIS